MISNFKWFFSFIGSKGRQFYYYSIFLALLLSVTELIGLSLVVPFIGVMLGIPTPSVPFADVLLVYDLKPLEMTYIVLGAYLVKMIIGVSGQYVINYLGFSVKNILQYKYFSRFVYGSLNDKLISKKSSADNIRDLTYEFNVVHGHFIVSSLNLISEGLVASFLLLVLFVYATEFTLVLSISFLFVIFFLQSIFKHRMYRWGEERARLDGELVHLAEYSVKGSKEVFVNRVELRVLAQLSGLQHKYRDVGYKQVASISVPKFLFEATAFLCVLGYVGFNHGQGDEILGELLLSSVAALRLLPSASKISSSLQSLRGAAPSLARIKRDLLKPDERPSALSFLIESKGFNYSFRKGGETLRYDQFSLGERGFFSIVGPSGSGKSTLLEIMLNMRSADLNVVHRSSFQTPIYVAQRSHIFSSTIKEALVEYCTSPVNPNWFSQVVSACSIDHLIKRESDVTPGLETSLSGGEFNRVVLARALMPKPDLLILDEATNGLDIDCRRVIYSFLKEYAREHLVVMISHDNKLLDYTDNSIKLNRR